MKKIIFIVVVFAFVSTAMGGQFPDVKTTHWAYRGVEALVEAGMFDGADGQLYCTEGRFNGTRLVNRYQIAIVVSKILKKTDPITSGPKKSVNFTDVPETHKARIAVRHVVNAGILECYDGKFNGKRLLNRFQMATILAKVLARNGIKTDSPESPIQFTDLMQSHWAYDAVQSVVKAKILISYDGKFQGKRLFNRYQMAVIIAKLLEVLDV